MTLQCDDADESCGLPGVKKPSGRGCGESAEMIAENSSLSAGLFTSKAKWSFSQWDHIVKRIPTRRARRYEDMGVGFTSIGVADKKL